MSADYLTEEGIASAKGRGTELAGDTEYLMVAGSKGVSRARETGGHILGSFRDEAGAAAVVNKEMSAEAQQQAGHGEMPPGDVVIYRSGDLDPVQKLAAVFKEAKAAGAEELTSQIQYWMDHPEEATAAGALTAEEAAAEFAHRLSIGLKMSERLYEGTDLRFENLTHGPKPDAFLREVMIQEDGSRGFEKLEDIGGAFEPGEEATFDIKRDENGELSITLQFRGKSHDVAMDRLAELQELYRKMQDKNGSNRKASPKGKRADARA